MRKLSNYARPKQGIIDLTSDGLRRVTSSELRQLLAQSITITAQGLAGAAAILAEMQRRGEDTSEFKTGLFNFLPAIADGRLSAELAVRYAGKLSLLRYISELSKPEQESILASGSVAIVEMINGRLMEHQVPLLRLSLGQMRQVFRPQGLADGDAQRRELVARKRSPQKPSERNQDHTISDKHRLSIAVSDDEAEILRELAISRKVTMTQLIRAALVECGYLVKPNTGTVRRVK